MPKKRRKATPLPDGYFVTGGTGFIGHHLIARLLERRTGTIYLLVREQSLPRLEVRLARWKAEAGRIVPVVGDVTMPRLGLRPRQLAELHGHVGHFFHVAGLYDMAATEEALDLVNVAGTKHAVAAAEGMGARHFHHVSSIAAAGRYRGVFREDMFDEATGLDDPYFRTKHESERVVRTRCSIPWRIYRPSLVVGHSETGEMDKVDGPYYLFPILEQVAAALPAVLSLPGIEGGFLNLVPVDFVAAAIDHIAHLKGRDGRTFHLVDPQPRTFGEALDCFAEAAGAPHFSFRVSGIETALTPLTRLLARNSNGLAGRLVGQAFGIPPRAFDYIGNQTVFDCQQTTAALEGSGIAVPRLESYARHLWVYWDHNLNTNTSHARSLDKAVGGKTVLITGASSGIGRATALKLGAAGAHVLLVARNAEQLEEVRGLIERTGGTATVLATDLTDAESVENLCRRVAQEVGAVDVLVNNAGRSIRRSLRISVDRFHDFERTMAINYFAAVRLILGLLPGMRRRRDGHIVNVSSIGVQTGPAALRGLRRLEGGARRVLQVRRARADRRRNRHHDRVHAAGQDRDDRADPPLRLVLRDHAGAGGRPDLLGHRAATETGEHRSRSDGRDQFQRGAALLRRRALPRLSAVPGLVRRARRSPLPRRAAEQPGQGLRSAAAGRALVAAIAGPLMDAGGR